MTRLSLPWLRPIRPDSTTYFVLIGQFSWITEFDTLLKARFSEVVWACWKWSVFMPHQNCPSEMEGERRWWRRMFQIADAAPRKLHLPSSVAVRSHDKQGRFTAQSVEMEWGQIGDTYTLVNTGGGRALAAINDVCVRMLWMHGLLSRRHSGVRC